MQLPLIPEIPQERSYLQEFRGLNRHDRIGEGEFYDMCNLSNDEYPVLATRKKRRTCPDEYAVIVGMEFLSGHLYVLGAKYADSAVCMIRDGMPTTEGIAAFCEAFDSSGYSGPYSIPNHVDSFSADPYGCVLWYDKNGTSGAGGYWLVGRDGTFTTPDSDIPDYPVDISTGEIPDEAMFNIYMYIDGEKADAPPIHSVVERQTTVNGLWILVMPDKMYFDTADNTWHSMERHYIGDSVRIHFVDDLYQTSPNATHTKLSDVVWEDGDTDTNETDSTMANFLPYDTLELRLSVQDADSGWADMYDGEFPVVFEASVVVISKGYDEDNKPYIIIDKKVDGIFGGDYKNGDKSTGDVRGLNIEIIRPVPDLDYFTASGNRIYGVRFSQEDGQTINSVYVSSAADIFDFSINTQGYSAWEGTIGETGAFTGICAFSSSVYAFKRDCAVRVAGSGANISTHVLHVPGVSYGAFRSLAEHEGYLYYKGDAGIYRFNGEYAQLISDAFGDRVYTGGVGAFLGDRYYILLKDTFDTAEADAYTLFKYDAAKGMWCKEALNPPTLMEAFENTLFMCGAKEGNVKVIEATHAGVQPGDLIINWDEEDDFDWWCQSGTQGYETPDEKHLGRLLVRMRLKPETVVRVMMQYDNETTWETVATIQDAGIRQTVVPIIPRRCDVYRMRIEGHGECRIYGITKTIEGGSDIQWHT